MKFDARYVALAGLALLLLFFAAVGERASLADARLPPRSLLPTPAFPVLPPRSPLPPPFPPGDGPVQEATPGVPEDVSG